MLRQGPLPFPVFTAFLPYFSLTCMGSSRLCEDICMFVCAYGAGTAVEEPGVLPELVHPVSFPDLRLPCCEGGSVASECSELRTCSSRSRGVCCLLFWVLILVPTCPCRNTYWDSQLISHFLPSCGGTSRTILSCFSSSFCSVSGLNTGVKTLH